MELFDGYTLMHEHMHIDLSKVKQDDDCHLNCFEESKKEMIALYEHGVRNIWEVTNIGMGRDIEYIKKIEEASGIHFILSTGCYKDPFIPKEFNMYSAQELAAVFIREIENGIDGTTIKASAIGEIGTSKDVWTEQELTLFDAAILAHKKTKKPIYTHTTLGTLGVQQAAYLTKHGVDPDKIVIGHMDLCGDLSTIREVLSYGVNVGFDTIGKKDYLPDEKRISMLLELAKDNVLSKVVLSEDLTRKSHLLYKGGIGYCYLFDEFLPALRKAGLSEDWIEQMLKHNPTRIFR